MRQCIGQALAQCGLIGGCDVQAQHRQLDVVFLEAVDAREVGGRQKVAVHSQMRKTTRPRPVRQLGIHALAARHQRRQQANVLAAIGLEQLRRDAVGRLRLHRSTVLEAMLCAQLHIQQAQVMPDLGGCAHRRLAPAARESLLDRHGRRNAIHRIHLGTPRRLHDGAGIGVERFQISALAFVEKDVKRQRRFSGAGDPCHHAEFAAWNIHAQRLEIVFLGVDDADVVVQRGPDGLRCNERITRSSQPNRRPYRIRPCQKRQIPRSLRGRLHIRIRRRKLAHLVHHAHGRRVIAQGPSGVRGGMQQHFFGRAHAHHMATTLAAFRPQVDQPVGGADHVQVVLDHHQRMPGVQQLAQGAHQLGNVVKVQAGGRLIQHEQRAAPRRGLAAGAAAFRGLGQETGQLEALRLAARQRGHGLAQLHVFQAHIHNRLQHADHVTVGAEQVGGFADRQVQHIGHVQFAALALDSDFQNLGAVALAIAVRAAQVDVAQELHLDVLKTRAAAGGAAAVAAIEAELGAGVAAFTRQGRNGKQFADGVPGAHVADRIGARRFANR